MYKAGTLLGRVAFGAESVKHKVENSMVIHGRVLKLGTCRGYILE